MNRSIYPSPLPLSPSRVWSLDLKALVSTETVQLLAVIRRFHGFEQTLRNFLLEATAHLHMYSTLAVLVKCTTEITEFMGS